MKTLIINAHPDPHAAEAATNRMVQHLVARLPAGSTEVVNLAETDIQPLDKDMLDAIVHAVFQRQQPDSGQRALLARSGEVIAKVKSSPRLVIAYPMYNFGIPARLKDWLDNIVMPGQTFQYDESGTPKGLMGAHKALLLQASGSVYSTGPMAQLEFSVSYLQALLGGFLGFASVEAVRAEGTAQAAGPEAAVQRALAEIDALLEGFLAD
jgi:FMN-dependent NADH-azoreductase